MLPRAGWCNTRYTAAMQPVGACETTPRSGAVGLATDSLARARCATSPHGAPTQLLPYMREDCGATGPVQMTPRIGAWEGCRAHWRSRPRGAVPAQRPRAQARGERPDDLIELPIGMRGEMAAAQARGEYQTTRSRSVCPPRGGPAHMCRCARAGETIKPKSVAVRP